MRKRQRVAFATTVLAAAVAFAVSTTASSTAAGASSGEPTAVSAASGTGGLGSKAVTNYLQYVDGKRGAAKANATPVQIGFVNQQGGAVVVGADATTGAQLAVKYDNAELGGVDGHPVELVTCFIASSEQEGTTCGQQFLADKSLSVIEEGGVATGIQSLYNTLAGAKPVIVGVAATAIDPVEKNAVILFGDATHILPPWGTYAAKVLHAKTAAVVYENEPGITTGAQAMIAALKKAGVTVKAIGYDPTETDVVGPLTSAGAQTADMVVPYTDANGCVNIANALTQLGITTAKRIVAPPLCLNGQVLSALGDFPKWTYGIASSLFGDKTDPGMAPYTAVADKYRYTSDAPDPWNIVNFGTTLSIIRFLNQLGYGHITPAAVLKQAKSFKGPQALGAPSLKCGQYPSAPAVCNNQAQFFTYDGKNQWTKASSWLKPPQ
jgi:branched-chain amino acid transport system substrate-binding protein